MIEYQIHIRLHPEPNGGWSVSLPQLPGVVSQGDTREEATANIAESFKGAAESYLASDGEIPWVDVPISRAPDGDHDLFIVVEVEPPEIPVKPVEIRWFDHGYRATRDIKKGEVCTTKASMKAGRSECPHCHGTGEIEVTIATGNQFTRECLNKECRFENGGHITEQLPLPDTSGPCVMCGGATRWKLVQCGE